MENLKKMKQWVLWSYTEDGRKIPRCPDNINKYLKWSNPDNFMTYKDAQMAAMKSGADGVGLIIPDRYYVIDLDHIRPGDPRAKDLIKYCKSYSEFSPSGNGIHVIIKADVSRSRNLTMGPGTKYPTKSGMIIELKRPGTFVTFTGNVIVNRPVADLTDLIRTTYDVCASADANNGQDVKERRGGSASQPVSREYARAALSGEVQKIKQATQGTRRNTIFIAAMKLKKYIGRGLDEAEVWRALEQAGNYHGFSRAIINSTIRNGMAAA
jgi:primase-polymerase (primpol)-like protein